MRECPTCHHQTPEGNFCVRCGSPLAVTLSEPRDRRQFAAAPGQRRYAPWLVSTLYPQLPRHSERHFRVALAVSVAAVALLGTLGLFPVALISAAMVMPLLTALYFYDVDIYEGEPLWAWLLTTGWGAATGVGAGLVTKGLAANSASLIDKGSSYHVVTGGILVPAIGVLLVLVGPLILLPYRRFNEALDGATFGAASAVAFAAAQAVIVGLDVLGGGVQPGGAAAPWVLRLLAIAVATPVLMMSAAGAAGGALWLRYRAPAKDRRALGVLGSPPVAILVAAVLVVAGALGETFMPAGLWLAWLVGLDLIGLVLLRRAVHVGLLEEQDEKDIGPLIQCANCGHSTATHTFCGNCGIALKALPKVRQADPGVAGASAGRLTTQGGGLAAHRRLLAFLAAATGTVIVAFVIAVLAAPAARKPPCASHRPCGSPPILPQVVFAFPGYTVWQSRALGYSLRYNARQWHVTSQDASGVTLQASDGFSQLTVSAAPASRASARALTERRISVLQNQLLGFTQDGARSDQILGPAVGLRAGSGGAFTATTTSPQGPQTPVLIALMAAGDRRLSLAATVIVAANNEDQRTVVYAHADDIINSILWPHR